MKLYRSEALPDQWIGEDAHGALLQWPARPKGWAERTPYLGPRRGLAERPPAEARGSGWPGAGAGRPPRAGGKAATKQVAFRISDEQEARWLAAAAEEPLAVWGRRELDAAAERKPKRR